ncbi:hypothetical protein [Nocardia sp. NPDC004711]
MSHFIAGCNLVAGRATTSPLAGQSSAISGNAGRFELLSHSLLL